MYNAVGLECSPCPQGQPRREAAWRPNQQTFVAFPVVFFDNLRRLAGVIPQRREGACCRNPERILRGISMHELFCGRERSPILRRPDDPMETPHPPATKRLPKSYLETTFLLSSNCSLIQMARIKPRFVG